MFEGEQINVKELRRSLGLSQPQFAAKMHIKLGILRSWEQGRRRPSGPAKVLLSLVAEQPELIEQTLGAAPVEQETLS